MSKWADYGFPKIHLSTPCKVMEGLFHAIFERYDSKGTFWINYLKKMTYHDYSVFQELDNYIADTGRFYLNVKKSKETNAACVFFGLSDFAEVIGEDLVMYNLFHRQPKLSPFWYVKYAMQRYKFINLLTHPLCERLYKDIGDGYGWGGEETYSHAQSVAIADINKRYVKKSMDDYIYDNYENPFWSAFSECKTHSRKPYPEEGYYNYLVRYTCHLRGNLKCRYIYESHPKYSRFDKNSEMLFFTSKYGDEFCSFNTGLKEGINILTADFTLPVPSTPIIGERNPAIDSIKSVGFYVKQVAIDFSSIFDFYDPIDIPTT